MHSSETEEAQVTEGVTATESTSSKQTLLEDCKSRKEKHTHNNHSSPPHTDEVLFSELEDEKETWPENERQQRLDRASSRLFRAVAQGAIKLKRRQKAGPRRGEDFTMKQAAVKADFWLLFFSVVCGAGSGLMVIDNLGQISQSLGFANAHIFVSMLSIWNFLGRIGGGYVSEIIARWVHISLPPPPLPLVLVVLSLSLSLTENF
jgi:hypothetical protein